MMQTRNVIPDLHMICGDDVVVSDNTVSIASGSVSGTVYATTLANPTLPARDGRYHVFAYNPNTSSDFLYTLYNIMTFGGAEVYIFIGSFIVPANSSNTYETAGLYLGNYSCLTCENLTTLTDNTHLTVYGRVVAG